MYLFSGDTKRRIEAEVAEASHFAQGANNTVDQLKISAKEKYILEAARVEWENNPFQRWTDLEEPLIPESHHPGPLEFNGYIEVGDRRIAVINGVEYQVGDELAQGGFWVRSISSNQVTIKSRNSNQAVTIFYDQTNAVE